jgi:hypothetical protein
MFNISARSSSVSRLAFATICPLIIPYSRRHTSNHCCIEERELQMAA